MQFTCRDGGVAHVRPIEPRDADGVHALFLALIDDGRGQVMQRSDLPPRPQWDERDLAVWLPGGERTGARGQRFLALRDHEVVGEASIHRFSPAFLRHGAIISVGIHPKAQGLGLGRALVETLLAWADAPPRDGEPAIERVELYVRADNPRAIALYRSVGFEEEGRRRGFVRTPDGECVDDLVLTRRTP